MAEVNNISLDQGENYTETLTYTDSNSDPIDMTGYTYELKVKESWSGSDTIFTLTGGSGIDTTNEATGVLVYTFTAAQTALLTKPQYQYQLKLTDGSGIVTILIEGHIMPDPAI